MRAKLFGTDGVRGVANKDPMTVETAVALGRAVAHSFREVREHPRILIGKDTRVSCYTFEHALAAGILAAGGGAYLLGPVPTPAVAFMTLSMRASAGVVISASHNPYMDNGIKFFGHDGFKLEDELEDRIAGWVTRAETRRFDARDAALGRAKWVSDALGRYVVFLKSTVPKELALDGLRVCIDCANGAAYKVAPLALEELGATVFRLGTEPNGTNINSACGALHPESLQRKVVETGADVGVALDGDADRCIMVDERGNLVDGDKVLGMSALWLKDRGELDGGSVVGTVMTNLGLERALEARGVGMLRCDVGDRYVVQAMRSEGICLGGEQSGHIVYLRHSTTGDGTLTALQVIAQMVETGEPLSKLASFYEPYPQVLRSVRVSSKPPIDEVEPMRKAMKAAAERLGKDGRLNVRYSGTEPKARVMIEGADRTLIDELANDLCATLEHELG